MHLASMASGSLLAAALLAALLLLTGEVTASFLTHTIDTKSSVKADSFCIDPPVELVHMKPYQFTQYQRTPAQAAKAKLRLAQDDRRLAEITKVETLYQAPVLLSTEMMEEGLSNLGDTRRLERAIFKLVKGQPITITALGGSVTAGSGVWRSQNSWTARFFSWVNETFPHKDHVFLNKAVPAVTSAYISPCVLNMVPEETDLVILEFTFNDAERATTFDLDDPTRRGLERLLRKLLRMKNRPGVLYYHFWPAPRTKHFWDGGEDRHDVLLKYYGLTTLSMRNALHLLVDKEPEQLDQMWWPSPSDRLHPSCIGTKYIADQVIGYMQDLAATVLRSYAGHETAPHPEVLTEALRGPVFEGNHADKAETCLLDDDFKKLASENQGWEYVNEGKLVDKPKWGYVSWAVGSKIVLKVPMNGITFDNNRLIIALGVLQSYEHMGYARVDCLSGCACPAREINLLFNWAFSMTYWKAMHVTLNEGSQECVMSIVNIDKTKSKEHKLKLTSIMVSGELAFVESWDNCKDCLNEGNKFVG